jgi:hypothetical protein
MVFVFIAVQFVPFRRFYAGQEQFAAVCVKVWQQILDRAALRAPQQGAVGLPKCLFGAGEYLPRHIGDRGFPCGHINAHKAAEAASFLHHLTLSYL